MKLSGWSRDESSIVSPEFCPLFFQQVVGGNDPTYSYKAEPILQAAEGGDTTVFLTLGTYSSAVVLTKAEGILNFLSPIPYSLIE